MLWVFVGSLFGETGEETTVREPSDPVRGGAGDVSVAGPEIDVYDTLSESREEQWLELK